LCIAISICIIAVIGIIIVFIANIIDIIVFICMIIVCIVTSGWWSRISATECAASHGQSVRPFGDFGSVRT
jgi:hypothetical protein